jgi:hypothetical protein
MMQQLADNADMRESPGHAAAQSEPDAGFKLAGLDGIGSFFFCHRVLFLLLI